MTKQPVKTRECDNETCVSVNPISSHHCDKCMESFKPTKTREWEEEFDRKFTVIVEYEKYPDEGEPQKLKEPVCRFTDFPNTNPKVIKAFIKKVEDTTKKDMIEKIEKMPSIYIGDHPIGILKMQYYKGGQYLLKSEVTKLLSSLNSKEE